MSMIEKYQNARAGDMSTYRTQMAIIPLFYLPITAAFIQHRGFVTTDLPLVVVGNSVLIITCLLLGLFFVVLIGLHIYNLFKDWNDRNSLADLSNRTAESVRSNMNLRDFFLLMALWLVTLYGGMGTIGTVFVALIVLANVLQISFSAIYAARWKYLAVTLPRRQNLNGL